MKKPRDPVLQESARGHLSIGREARGFYEKHGFNIVGNERKLSSNMRGQKYSDSDRQLVLNAFRFAAQSHAGSMRATGPTYLEHPLQMALYTLKRGGDAQTVTTHLLHDVLEEAEIDGVEPVDNPAYSQIKHHFGQAMADRILLLTRRKTPPNIPKHEKLELYKQYIHRILTSGDMKAIWTKLVDVTSNLGSIPELGVEGRGKEWQESQLEKYSLLRDAADSLDPELSAQIRKGLNKLGGTFPSHAATDRVVTAPSRLDPTYLLKLPPASSMSAVVYQPIEDHHIVDVGLPWNPRLGLTDKYWANALREIQGNGGSGLKGFENLSKRLPSKAGRRIHFRLETDAPASDEWAGFNLVKERVKALHEKALPKWPLKPIRPRG